QKPVKVETPVLFVLGRLAVGRRGAARQRTDARCRRRQAQGLVGEVLTLSSKGHEARGASEKRGRYRSSEHLGPTFLAESPCIEACHDVHHHMLKLRANIWSSRRSGLRSPVPSLRVRVP